FVPQAHLDGGGVGNLKSVLHESIAVFLPELHLGNASLALLNSRQSEEETGKRRTCPIAGPGLGSVAIGELVITAILKESPHRPDIVAEAAPEFKAMAAALPA